MGTGQTLALLPPQNATGNFVKIVQRLPVRIELTDYDPDKAPLFVGLSVDALRVLQGAAHGAARRRGPATAPPAPARPAAPTPGSRAPEPRPTAPAALTMRIERTDPVDRHPKEPRMSTVASPTAVSRPAVNPWFVAVGGRRAHVHGGAGHHDRQRRPAVHRRRPVGAADRQPSGSSPATWPPTPSSCRSPAGCRPTSAAATTSCCRSPSSPSPRRCAAWPPAWSR